MADLPTDTVAAVGLGGADRLITGAWGQRPQGAGRRRPWAPSWTPQLQQLEQQTASALPGRRGEGPGRPRRSSSSVRSQDGSPVRRRAGRPASLAAVDKISGVLTSHLVCS